MRFDCTSFLSVVVPLLAYTLPTSALPNIKCRTNSNQNCMQIAAEQHVGAGGVANILSDQVQMANGYRDQSETDLVKKSLFDLIQEPMACSRDGVYCEDYTNGPDGVEAKLLFANREFVKNTRVMKEGALSYVCACFDA
ncbi:uncharacterized protein SPPG_02569 [Spizellomyces punctatus DAOM BR117]|uniref:Uncharacterized protein n=1 Tax=Spizellomyces punctatus (strain DAOM BR117) TaxID=645134 RepID=A0A0L0HKX0_SPIPD|nr:uncharacterized protein SPPG_02569 [Spizellomyces punctatus DAOM BR117]KND02066.1 hypothetical protein SPPG_02569 [Spizellomyces punctatus DAOM BR117]|eukprot:XP_016610105.1 hypothetical protein SPPG_02569 [Spizellomyces punctatus DAOM BR117]